MSNIQLEGNCTFNQTLTLQWYQCGFNVALDLCDLLLGITILLVFILLFIILTHIRHAYKTTWWCCPRWKRPFRPTLQESDERLNNFVQEKQLTGGKVTPSPNPPDITYQPWNQVVLMDILTGGGKTYDVQMLVDLLKAQVDPKKRGFNQGTGESTLIIQLRISTVYAWNLTGKVISLSLTDFTDSRTASENREQLAGLVDAGTRTHTPAVGYKYPSSLRQTVLQNDKYDRNVDLFVVNFGSTDSVCLHIHIEYRFDGPITPPTSRLTEALLLEQLTTTSSAASRSLRKLVGINDVVQRLDQIAKSTSDSQKSSYIDKVISGVKHTAMLVAAAADEADDARFFQTFESLPLFQ